MSARIDRCAAGNPRLSAETGDERGSAASRRAWGWRFLWFQPPWILARWAAVGSPWTTLQRWMRRSLVLAAVVGAVRGTLSLRMGAAVGAIALAEPRAWIPAVGLQWALTAPLLVALSRRLVP